MKVMPGDRNHSIGGCLVEVTIRYIKKKMRLAAVFSDQNLPAYFMGLPVLNGDESDLTFLAPKNTILGLYAKGKAKKDTSGFIIKTIPILAI